MKGAPISRRTAANALGCFSILLSPPIAWGLLLWNEAPNWLRELPFNAWFTSWIVGFVFACGAAWLGSRWWSASALMTLLTALGTISILASF